MATRVSVSPAANLLRRSRLFSLPPQLPSPPRPLSAEPLAYSETATKIYPTHQAIVTPPASAARGDWGLKRPLPAKSTVDRSAAPIVRVNRLDTLEHITDFDSAADHTRTLQKFAELELAVSVPEHTTRRTVSVARQAHRSAFEADGVPDVEEGVGESTSPAGSSRSHGSPDSTAPPDAANAEAQAAQHKPAPPPARYHYSGPWVAGQSEAEFNAYLARVKARKPAFLRHLRKRFREIKQQNARSEQMHAEGIPAKDGPAGEATAASAPPPPPINEQEFARWLHLERQNPRELGALIREFLDLAPPVQPQASYVVRHSRQWDSGPSNVLSAHYAMHGPPATHPSAGLSYLRTNARVFNHPAHGPQEHRPPVEARVLKSARSGSSMQRGAAGVAGFIAADSGITFADQALQDPDVPGGLKVKTIPTAATVDSDGRVMLRVTPARTAPISFGLRPGAYGRGRSGGRYMERLVSLRDTANYASRPLGKSRERYADELFTGRG
ncbi:hypothetical protein KEM52_005310 [Ascosphaera acerosa]|nr:hypothetical protein KEM52_005310 [Ascosphaera acerosa]